MNVGLIAIVVIVAACIGVYLFFLSHYHTKSAQDEDLTIPDDRVRTERAISESPIYKQTKEQMKHLRTDLDRFSETLDIVSEEIRNSSPEDLDNVYQRGIPRIHGTLIDARNAAEDLLAAVEGRPEGNTVRVDMVGEKHGAPQLNAAGSKPPSKAEELYDFLLETGNRVSPYIAGFYFSLTVADENSQEIDAAEQARLIIEQLDETIFVMTELEKELTGT